MESLAGIHAVMEALRAGRPIDRVLAVKGTGGSRLQEIIDLCRKLRVPLRFETRDTLDRLARGSVHQGVLAITAQQHYAALNDMLASAALLVVLDGVEDPHNLGAVIRTAHAAGASAVVIPERRAAPVTAAAAKAAAGAIEHLPVARVANINRALETAKQQGFWIYGFDERGDQTYDKVDYSPRSVMVFGSEGQGLHEQVRKHCDFLVRIPLAGQIASLNVSVAAGIALFEWKRRRTTGEATR